MQTYDKCEIAIEILDAAIAEYLDDQRYFAAFNLAGVAEEILGKIVRLSGGTDALTRLVKQNEYVSAALDQKPLAVKGWKDLINTLKNSIKHMDAESDRQIEANMRDEARRMIGRALVNYRTLGLGSRDTVKRFIASRDHELKTRQTGLRNKNQRCTS